MLGGISWMIIGILVVVFLLVLKARHIKHRFFALLLVLLIIFVYFTSTSLLSGKNLDLKTFEGWTSFGKIYFSWLWHAGGNAKVVIGDVIKMDWVGNSSAVVNATG